jgi:hypothetical protein
MNTTWENLIHGTKSAVGSEKMKWKFWSEIFFNLFHIQESFPAKYSHRNHCYLVRAYCLVFKLCSLTLEYTRRAKHFEPKYRSSLGTSIVRIIITVIKIQYIMLTRASIYTTAMRFTRKFALIRNGCKYVRREDAFSYTKLPKRILASL